MYRFIHNPLIPKGGILKDMKKLYRIWLWIVWGVPITGELSYYWRFMFNIKK